MRVLVTGGRDYMDQDHVLEFLDTFNRNSPITCIIHGGASGVDTFAGRWASVNGGVDVEVYRAEWGNRMYGRRAGAVRNQRMLDEGQPDVVIAFPGGNGTADMVRRAKGADVPTMKVKRPF